jgi:dihydrofolate reductase
MIVAIVAIAKNYAIGKDGKLPWHYPADLKFFKESTTGHAIVMGLNTWESIGRPLPNRLNIILSRTAQITESDNIKVLRSKGEVLELAEELDTDLFIIGGARTYATFADVIDKWLVTEVPETVQDADTFMDPGFLNGFTLQQVKTLEGELQVKTYERLQNWAG